MRENSCHQLVLEHFTAVNTYSTTFLQCLYLLDKMSVEVYSECRLQLPFTDGQMKTFDRCLIELRQHDIGDYALRTIDLNNNKSVRIAYE